MSKNTTEVSRCNKNGDNSINLDDSPRRKKQSKVVRLVKTGLAFVFVRPSVFRWAIVHLPDIFETIETWSKKVISYLSDIF